MQAESCRWTVALHVDDDCEVHLEPVVPSDDSCDAAQRYRWISSEQSLEVSAVAAQVIPILDFCQMTSVVVPQSADVVVVADDDGSPTALPPNLVVAPQGGTGDEASSALLFDSAFTPLLDALWQGHNAVLLVVGKSTKHRERVVIGSPESFGLIPHIVGKVFDALECPSLNQVVSPSFVERAANSRPTQVWTSFVALSTNSVIDLVDRDRKNVSVHLRESEHHGLAGSTSSVEGERRVLSANVDDALETLDIGLEFLAAAEEKGTIQRGAVTLVFTIYVFHENFCSSFAIVSVGSDTHLLRWLEQCIRDSSARNRFLGSAGPGRSLGEGNTEDDFVPQPFHHQVATLLIPTLCHGNCRVGLVVCPPRRPKPSECPDAPSYEEDLQALNQVLSTAHDASCLTTLPTPQAPRDPPLEQALPERRAMPPPDLPAADGDFIAEDVDLPLPEGWLQERTPSGRPYYVDQRSGISRWTHPLVERSVGTGVEACPEEATKRNREQVRAGTDDICYAVDHNRQCWMAPHSVSTAAQISVMVMDPEVATPRVIVIGSHDLASIIGEEMERASPARRTTNDSVTKGTPPQRSARRDSNSTDDKDASPLFNSPVHVQAPETPIRTADATGEGLSSPERYTAGEIRLNDDTMRAVATATFVQEINARHPDLLVEHVIVRPTTDDEKIVSFLIELEQILQRATRAEQALKHLASTLPRSPDSPTHSSSNTKSTSWHSLWMEIRARADQSPTDEEFGPLFETFSSSASELAALEGGDPQEAAAAAAVKQYISALQLENAKLRSFTRVDENAASYTPLERTQSPLGDEELHERHKRIVFKLCEKQKTVIRRMYTDFEQVLNKEKRRSESYRQLVGELRRELSAERQRVSELQNFVSLAANATTERNSPMSNRALLPMSDPSSPNVARILRDDALGLASLVSAETRALPLSNTRSSTTTDERSPARANATRDSSKATSDDEEKTLRKLRRYRAGCASDGSVTVQRDADLRRPRGDHPAEGHVAAAKSVGQLEFFTKPQSAAELLRQRHNSIQKLLREPLSPGASIGAESNHAQLVSRLRYGTQLAVPESRDRARHAWLEVPSSRNTNDPLVEHNPGLFSE